MNQISILDWFDITLSHPSKRPMISRDVYDAASTLFLNQQCSKFVSEATVKSAGHVCEKGDCTTCTTHVARIPWQRASKAVIRYLTKNKVPTLFPGYTAHSWTGGNWADVISKSGDMRLLVRSNYGKLGTRSSKNLPLRQVVKSFLSHDPAYEQVSASPTRTATQPVRLRRGVKVKNDASLSTSSNDDETDFGGGDANSIGEAVSLEALPKYAGNNKLTPLKAEQLGIVLPTALANKKLEKPSLWLGGQGSFSVLHADHRNGGNIIQQCLGQKRFYIFPPNAMKYLNVQTRNYVRWGIPADPRYVEVNAAQEREFPAAAAIGMTVLLRPGDMFMNQDSFYHAAENETPSLMVNTWIKP